MYDLAYYNRGEYIFYADHITTFGDIYEFGVFGGISLEFFIKELELYNKSYGKIFGFDSFEGLPEEDPSVKTFVDWAPGNFNAQTLYGATKEEVKKQILKRTQHIPILIDGWFNDTLNQHSIQQHNMKPASYINIDVDLYVSTCQVLEFIFQNNLWQHGTIVRYDDWMLDPDMGEHKAHDEITKKYNVQCELLIPHLPHLFRLLK
jgi:hypothetical protein